MVVVLSASLPQDGVFFAGEKFVCVLTFTNTVQRLDLPGVYQDHSRTHSHGNGHHHQTFQHNGNSDKNHHHHPNDMGNRRPHSAYIPALSADAPAHPSLAPPVLPTDYYKENGSSNSHRDDHVVSRTRRSYSEASSYSGPKADPTKLGAESTASQNASSGGLVISTALKMLAGTFFGTSAPTVPNNPTAQSGFNTRNTSELSLTDPPKPQPRRRDLDAMGSSTDILATSEFQAKGFIPNYETIPETIPGEPSLPHSISQTSDVASPGLVQYLSPIYSPTSGVTIDAPNSAWKLHQAAGGESADSSRSASRTDVLTESVDSLSADPIELEGQMLDQGGKIELHSSQTITEESKASRRCSMIHARPTDDLEILTPNTQDGTIRTAVTNGTSSNYSSTLSPMSDQTTPFTSSSLTPALAQLKVGTLFLKRRSTDPAVPLGAREDIAWAFAQMTGQFTVDSTHVKTSSFSPLRQKVMYRAAGSASGHGSQGGGGTLGVPSPSPVVVKRNETQPLPLYSTPPSILFCDLSLAPGESKSFKYEILLPSILPPSHRGKVARFFYKLIVGIQRSGKIRQSQIISIPFRLFNRTNFNGTRPVYEVMSPVVVNKDESIVTAQKSTANTTIFTPTSPEPDGLPGSLFAPASHQASIMDFNEYTTSMNNIANICQTSKKVSYEICKNNEHVAQLTLARIAYRLGETIVVVLNFTNGTIPCLQASVFLESIEVVEAPFVLKSKQQTSAYSRRCHAELHRSTFNSRRLVLSVTIPPTATADFQSTAVSMHWSLRVEFVTGIAGQMQQTPSMVDEGFRHHHVAKRAEVEPFDCSIPLKVYGGMRALKRTNKTFTFA
ncbi:hypothetical protein BASA84_000755 [Batrachochytrium salamandrivorans]|nr:hypothetical protein BASA81_004358 [Batrachochytrium salamandrivorans]KAH9267213.1 hypothetical protein BASA84_000755 [Batrachochytrium salamandrivorans]